MNYTDNARIKSNGKVNIKKGNNGDTHLPYRRKGVYRPRKR